MIMQYVQFVAHGCGTPSFFSLPTWYKYLQTTAVQGQCTPEITSLSDIWLVVAAIVDILLRVAALLAVFFIIYGGVQYISSQGNPDAANRGSSTITNALLGLLLSISAAAIVQFIAGRFH